MSAEIYDLGLFRERIAPGRTLETLAFIESEIRRIGPGLSKEGLRQTGLPFQAHSLMEKLLALPDRPDDTSTEWQMVTELKRIDLLRKTDIVECVVSRVLWIDNLLAHYGHHDVSRKPAPGAANKGCSHDRTNSQPRRSHQSRPSTPTVEQFGLCSARDQPHAPARPLHRAH
jgi:hypothetical protein